MIEGNLIGTDSKGTSPLGNATYGIEILGGSGTGGATNDTIGGTTGAAANIIAASGSGSPLSKDGIYIQIAGIGGVTVEGNYIGTDPAGDNLGNGGDGIHLFASQNTIGGTAAAAGNIIADNSGNGVLLVLDSNLNTILSNSIDNNGKLGINFGNGPTPNHLNEQNAIPGPNNYQNYPILSSVVSGSGSTTIQGTLNAGANTQYLVQFFASPTADTSGYGEGKIYLGSAMVTTDGTFNAAINVILPVAVPGGYFATATATDPLGNTSEFGPDVATLATADIGISGSASENPAYVGDNLTYTFTITNAGPDTAHGVTFTDVVPAGLNFVRRLDVHTGSRSHDQRRHGDRGDSGRWR